MYYRDRGGHPHAARSRQLFLDGCRFVTWACATHEGAALTAEVGTNGRAGPLSRTFIRVSDCSTSGLQPSLTRDGFSLIVRSEEELLSVMDALRWILSVLEHQTGRQPWNHRQPALPSI